MDEKKSAYLAMGVLGLVVGFLLSHFWIDHVDVVLLKNGTGRGAEVAAFRQGDWAAEITCETFKDLIKQSDIKRGQPGNDYLCDD